MSKKCYIVGAGTVNIDELVFEEGSYIIAADKGLEYLKKKDIVPDIIIGDFDSLGHIPEENNIIAHTPEKDDTDMMLSVKYALTKGFKEIIIYGGLGGSRFDHSLANIQTLAYIAQHNAHGFLIGEKSTCTVIKNSKILFNKTWKKGISVFSLGNMAKGVTLSGLKYELNDYDLTCDFPLGVSNEFTGVPATVGVNDGLLLVILNSIEMPEIFVFKDND